MFFEFWLFIEGATEKVLHFVIPLSQFTTKTLVSLDKKMYFWTLQRGSNKKKAIKLHYFGHDNFFLLTFLELPSIGLC
jgi:hypothetical protein